MTFIALNVAVFVLVLFGSGDSNALTGETRLHFDYAVGRDVLGTDLAFRFGNEIITTQSGGWYRLLTSGFFHFGIIHLAMNCYFIYVLGPQLERPLGRVKFALLYLASLFGGSLGVVLIEGPGLVFSAGASGAAFGMIAAVAMGMWRRGVNPFSTGIGRILLLNVFITVFVPNISIGGHLGGAIAGAICGAIMLSPGHKPLPKWASYATPLAVGIGSIVVSIVIVGTV